MRFRNERIGSTLTTLCSVYVCCVVPALVNGQTLCAPQPASYAPPSHCVQAAARWQPIAARVQQVQYAPSYGSSGGTGGYPIVLRNDGGYGGAYGSGYAPAGSSAPYGGYYLPPAYYQPSTHLQSPQFYDGHYLNPRPVVCGPWGCFPQQ